LIAKVFKNEQTLSDTFSSFVVTILLKQGVFLVFKKKQ